MAKVRVSVNPAESKTAKKVAKLLKEVQVARVRDKGPHRMEAARKSPVDPTAAALKMVNTRSNSSLIRASMSDLLAALRWKDVRKTKLPLKRFKLKTSTSTNKEESLSISTNRSTFSKKYSSLSRKRLSSK